MSSTEIEGNNSTLKLRVCLEGQEKDEATEIEVAGDSVSCKIILNYFLWILIFLLAFMQAIASSGYLTAQPVADFEAITLDDQILKPRQKLALLDIKDDSVFILKVKEVEENDSENAANDDEDDPLDDFGGRGGGSRGRGRGRGRRGLGRGRGRGRRSGWRFQSFGETVFNITAGEDVATENLAGFSIARRDILDKVGLRLFTGSDQNSLKENWRSDRQRSDGLHHRRGFEDDFTRRTRWRRQPVL